jgi:hypothetical protein
MNLFRNIKDIDQIYLPVRRQGKLSNWCRTWTATKSIYTVVEGVGRGEKKYIGRKRAITSEVLPHISHGRPKHHKRTGCILRVQIPVLEFPEYKTRVLTSISRVEIRQQYGTVFWYDIIKRNGNLYFSETVLVFWVLTPCMNTKQDDHYTNKCIHWLISWDTVHSVIGIRCCTLHYFVLQHVTYEKPVHMCLCTCMYVRMRRGSAPAQSSHDHSV